MLDDRPTLAAGAVVIAAAVYEVTPLKRHFRRRCREATGSGFAFGLCCVGSSLGLMAMMLALGVMSITWMAVIAAAVYEVTPLKQHFRRRCRDSVRSGLRFGLCCAGSSLGLMLMLVALGVMSIAWMALVAVLVLAQKLLPAKTAVDLPLALAIAGLGVLILAAPCLLYTSPSPRD